jgi:photosystem II stability/assembly factor-like uncharacterized protein
MHNKMLLISSFLVLILGSCVRVPAFALSTGTPRAVIESPISPATAEIEPGPSGTSTSTKIHFSTPPAFPVNPAPVLVRIVFQDAINGWGISIENSGSILRTVDGGTDWLNVTPSGLTGIGYSTNLYVLDNNKVWVLVPNADFFTGRLFRTLDGGVTWNFFDVPFGGGFIQFLDGITGRVLADRGAGLGSNSVEMYQTSDGGESWLSVYNNDPSRPDSSNSLPLSGIKNGMFFLNANTGWVTGTRPVDGEVYLFLTQDGGISWQQQSIPLPAGYENFQYMPQAPVIFGRDGFLPLLIYLSNSTDLTFYFTRDGGTTWTGDPKIASRVSIPGHFSFTDGIHGWNWDGGTSLFSTTNSALSWVALPTNLDLKDRLAQIDFVRGPGDQFTGWALTSVDDSGHAQLYKSTDNGAAWTQLIP